MFASVLVANRGEIAFRVIRTLKRLGIRSIAVYSEADAAAPHVRAADTAVPLGPAPAAESYLSAERVLAAAARSGAEAIHPGYGFLSEDAEFAAACEEAGLVFIGPPPAATRLLGDKVAAKTLAERLGVPALPGLQKPGLADEEIVAFVGEDPARLPLMIKAAAGRRRTRDARSSATPRRSPTASPPPAARRWPASATTRCWSSATSSAPATSRSRSSPTPTAPSSTSASASAASSAATRRWSRRARPR